MPVGGPSPVCCTRTTMSRTEWGMAQASPEGRARSIALYPHVPVCGTGLLLALDG